MKLEIKLIPSDMNEAQAILKALGSFTIGGTQKVTDTVGAVSHTVETFVDNGAPNGDKTVATTVESKEDGSIAVVDSRVMPELKDLTLGTERDNENRLWCSEINTSNKGTKADGTFKRAPKLDDAYFDYVINLLNQEAITFTPAPAPQPEPAPAPQPEPAPAPQPEPAPAAERTVVAYMYNDQRYNPEQLAGWSAEQIAANCEPVYDDAAPETTTVCLETQVKPLVSELAGNDGMAIHCQKLCGLLSGKEKGIPQDVPEEKRAQLLKALETMKANKVAVKDGSMPVEQLI